MNLSPMAMEIMAYLQSHQKARDSLEGIIEWWMVERNILRVSGEVRLAMKELVAGGFVEELERAGSVQYRLNMRR